MIIEAIMGTIKEPIMGIKKGAIATIVFIT